ncbi:MAG: hypothetical protein H6745_05100 [Deltaproteobacteria bacterium]|nr:hypothetical protein [Deltaproteobacteria bacterium]
MTLSTVGFGDRARHFLLRYLSAEATHPELARLFAERGASLFMEGSRAVFNAANQATIAASLEAYRELVGTSRELVAASHGALAVFCEMPGWIGAVSGMERWGDVPLLHGTVLFQIR